MMASDPGPSGPRARAFYQRPTVAVARDLLGKLVLSRTDAGVVALRVTEVEAYLGPSDAACHTRGGLRSPRNRSMWGPAGHSYVYRIYGLHHCLNVVTVGDGAGEAVLIRGGTLVRGAPLAERRRGRNDADGRLCDGPGKLCQALGVTLELDGADLCEGEASLWVEDDGLEVEEGAVRRCARVGVGYAGEAAALPLRFLWQPPRP